jgi:hypothetical protein
MSVQIPDPSSFSKVGNDITFNFKNFDGNDGFPALPEVPEVSLKINQINAIKFAFVNANFFLYHQDTAGYRDGTNSPYTDGLNFTPEVNDNLIIIFPNEYRPDIITNSKIRQFKLDGNNEAEISQSGGIINSDESFYIPLDVQNDKVDIIDNNNKKVIITNINGFEYKIKHDSNIINSNATLGDTGSYGDIVYVIGSGMGSFITSASSTGDPYVNTLDGAFYKLPNKMATYRLLQTNDIIINGLVDRLPAKSENEINEFLKDNYKDYNLILNGYYYNKFYIKYKNSYLVYDLKFNLIEKEINDDFTIRYDNTIKYFDSKIEGTSRYVSTYIEMEDSENGKVVIELNCFENPQIINGVNVRVSKMTESVKGVFADNVHPKNNVIKSLESDKLVSYDKLNLKPYKKDFDELWLSN